MTRLTCKLPFLVHPKLPFFDLGVPKMALLVLETKNGDHLCLRVCTYCEVQLLDNAAQRSLCNSAI